MQQVKFFDKESGEIHGGILMDDGSMICACCGGLIEEDMIGDEYEIFETYENWVDFSDAIID